MVLFVAGALGSLPSCSGSASKAQNANADPCTTNYAGQCGVACTSDANCSSGLYCGTGNKCTADCATSGASCGDGMTCSTRGRCQAAGGLLGGGLGLDGSIGDASACLVERLHGEGLPADIYIMNDQSASMGCATPTGGDRWTAMKAALTGFVSSPGAAGLGVGIQYFGQGPTAVSSCNVGDYTPADVEMHAFPLQSNSLCCVTAAGGSKTDPATCVDHSVPRQCCVRWQSVQRIAHLPCVKWNLCQRGHLAICSDPPTRNSPDDCVDSVVE